MNKNLGDWESDEQLTTFNKANNGNNNNNANKSNNHENNINSVNNISSIEAALLQRNQNVNVSRNRSSVRSIKLLESPRGIRSFTRDFRMQKLCNKCTSLSKT